MTCNAAYGTGIFVHGDCALMHWHLYVIGAQDMPGQMRSGAAYKFLVFMPFMAVYRPCMSSALLEGAPLPQAVAHKGVREMDSSSSAALRGFFWGVDACLEVNPRGNFGVSLTYKTAPAAGETSSGPPPAPAERLPLRHSV